MKKTNQCPKCNHEKIICITGNFREGRHLNYGLLAHPIAVDRYFCTKCGFSEVYISEKDMEKAVKHFGE